MPFREELAFGFVGLVVPHLPGLLLGPEAVAAAGTMLPATRIWDAVHDPMAGADAGERWR